MRLEGVDGERPYTPYQRKGASGAGPFELVVKAYVEGVLSPRIASLQPGDALLLRGPLSGAPTLVAGVRAIGLVAGGTGLTPMLQVIYSLVRSRARQQPEVVPRLTDAPPHSASRDMSSAFASGTDVGGYAGGGAEGGVLPSLRLVCFNRQEEDILVPDELAELSAAHPGLQVFHSLSDPPPAWSGGVGRPSKQTLQAQLPAPAPDVRVFWCGPPAFNSVVRQLLGELGYTDDMVHEFS